MVKMDLLRDPISASREVIRFRFKTSTASGALMYSRGTQGDYLALQLRDNRLVLNIDLGEFHKYEAMKRYLLNESRVNLKQFMA